MKKKLICFVLAIMMVSLLVCPAYAAEISEGWVLIGDAEYITHGDDKYYPVEFPYNCYVDYNLDWGTVDLEFADQKVAQTYDSSFIYVTQNVEDIVIEVTLCKDGVMGATVPYVEEAYYDEFVQISQGDPSSYAVENSYLEFDQFTVNQFNSWDDGDRKTIVGYDIDDYEWYYVCASDASGVFMHEVGMILYEPYDDELYFLKYEECDPNCFDSNGYFVGNDMASYTIYEIEDDDKLENAINGNYNYYDDGDDLFFGDLEYSTPIFAVIFATLIFGIIPLGAITFAVVKIIKGKDKKYRPAYIILTIGAALMLVAYVVLLALLAL